MKLSPPRFENAGECAEFIVRLTHALTAKAKGMPKVGYFEDEWLEVVVATTVADTWLVLSGTFPIENYEVG